jgi:hypothetical protein
LTGTLPTALAIGGVCALKASYTPTTYLSTTDTATFNGNFANAALSTPSAVQLVLTGPSTPPAASIGISFLPAAPVYGQSVTVTATLSGSSVTPAGTVVFTVDSTNTTITVANGVANLVLNGLTGGTHKISAVYTSTNGFASATASAVTLTVTTASTTATVTSNNNPALLQSIITLTAKVTSSAGTPTQTVTFLDGSTSIGTGTLSGGQTTLNTSTLAAGTHSITVSYGGDTNFAPSTSTALAQLVVDFNFSISSPTVVVSPGGVAVFTFTVTPVGSSSFPTAVNLAASGLPAGATSVFSPATLAAGAGATTVTLTVDIPQTQASARPYTARPGSQLAGNSRGSKAGGLTARLMPFTLALLLLPFAGRLRRTSKRLGRMFSVLLLLAAGAATLAGIGGCGSSSGYFAQQQQTYTITVTGTAGALSHSATVTLTVE